MADETEEYVSSVWKTWGIVAIIMLLIRIVIIVFLLWLIYKNRDAAKQTIKNTAGKMFYDIGTSVRNLGVDISGRAPRDPPPYVSQPGQPSPPPYGSQPGQPSPPLYGSQPGQPSPPLYGSTSQPQPQVQLRTGGKCNCISGGAVNSIKYLDKLLKK